MTQEIITGDPYSLYEINPVVYGQLLVDLSDETNRSKRCTPCDGAGCEECLETGYKHLRSFLHRMLFTPTNVAIPIVKVNELTHVQVIPGARINNPVLGPQKSDVMIIADELDELSSVCQTHFHCSHVGEQQTPGTVLTGIFNEANIPAEVYNTWYFTSVLKFIPPGLITGNIPAVYYKYFHFMLAHEISLVQPKVIVLLGATPTKHIMGNSAKFSQLLGSIMRMSSLEQLGSPFPLNNDVNTTGAYVICTQSPRALLHNAFCIPDSVKDFKRVVDLVTDKLDETKAKLRYQYIDNLVDLSAFVDQMSSYKELAIDCEWGGADVNTGYLRSIQISWRVNYAAVITFYRKGGVPTELADDLDENGYPTYTQDALRGIKDVLCRTGVKLIGHNLRADLIWIVKHLRLPQVTDYVFFDTMLAHHTMNDTLAHDLTSLSRQYTNLGVYDLELEAYKKDNKISEAQLDADSYGMIPDEILGVYSAKDADATFQIYKVLLPEIENNPEWRQLFYGTVMAVTPAILEIESVGLRVDTKRLLKLIHLYAQASIVIEERLKEITNNPTFNINSPKQVSRLLFGEPAFTEDGLIVNLGMRPIQSTGKYSLPWDEVEESEFYDTQLSYIDQKTFGTSTDSDTLDELLGDVTVGYAEHVKAVYNTILTPKDIQRAASILEAIRDYRLVGQMCKNFTRPPNEAGIYDGGLMKFLNPQGAITTVIGQMTGTGRYTSSKPNLQNIPKHGEKDIIKAVARALGKDKSEIPPVRSIFIPREGKVFIEADYSSAETFVLAYLSGDEVLEDDAKKDPHSRNAVALLKAPKYDGYDKGKKPDSEWKEKYTALRAGSKELSFGIPYGKQATSMARSITLKSGLPCTREQAAGYIKAWQKKYPKAYAFLVKNGILATTTWQVKMPSGRSRMFPPTTNARKLSAYTREAFNAPIQGTVGDLLTTSLITLYNYRKAKKCPDFSILLVIHDAILVECDLEHIKEVSKALELCMGKLSVIPGINKSLGVDIDYSFRWCEELSAGKKEILNQLLEN